MAETPTSRLKPDTDDPSHFAACVARLLADSKCEDVVVLDLRGVSQVTDCFVIATGTSDRQLRSVGYELTELAQTLNHTAHSVHGRESARWIVVDFIDVVVHLFDGELRAYYDLESLWGDARSVDWQAVTTPGQFAHIGRRRSSPSVA